MKENKNKWSSFQLLLERLNIIKIALTEFEQALGVGDVIMQQTPSKILILTIK